MRKLIIFILLLLFFMFSFLFFFIFKLYIIVLVLPNIKMNPPQVYMCSPSWTLLPPPSPYHPSGSCQCTSPKHPVSCIEPGLATRFLHHILHVSMLFSQIFPPSPSPTESIRLLIILKSVSSKKRCVPDVSVVMAFGIRYSNQFLKLQCWVSKRAFIALQRMAIRFVFIHK